jgi:hypothetical protein
MYRNHFVKEGGSVVLDDDLVMHFTKHRRLPECRYPCRR